MVIAHLNLGYTQAQARELIEQSLRVVGLRGEEVLEKYRTSSAAGSASA
jgi:hypothetical protein